MIQPHELRKGNKVLLEGMLLTVKEIKEHEATFMETPAAVEYPDIDPIPLSPEILVACGFTTDEHALFWHNGKMSIITPGNGGYENGRLYFNSWFIMEPPKHLHSLMNAFFTLTGTELTFNLEKMKV